MKYSLLVFLLTFTFFITTEKNVVAQEGANHGIKFEQLGPMLPTANAYRSMDGTPGPKYWQQRCDYNIECTLDTKNQRLDGSEQITYFNQSPHTLKYLWLQLDENQHSDESDNNYFDPSVINENMSEMDLRKLEPWRELAKYGHNIQEVTLPNGEELTYTINKTMMRVELPQPLKPGDSFTFHVKWYYYLIDRINSTGLARGGYEYFAKDKNYLYTITQWFPRLCSYTDYSGWQNKQFTGRGEFALTFGNYVVKMTVPKDHMVGATGECLNYKDVLTDTQFARWEKAQTAKEPLEIVTLAEAKKMEKKKRKPEVQTWIYKAENVRDFAWTASPKFIWDAMAVKNEDGKKVMCMSYYPKEAYPIYRKFSTKAVAHTLEVYSKHSIPYPYPVAISVEAANGMEYPMICFNPGRAEEDGTYTEEAKNSAITVIIHEVGHNYFPMIINSDERQWAWFDEGINTFVQFLAEQEFDNNYKSWTGDPTIVTGYMSLPKDQLEPIMTNSENIVDYFTNAYLKPAAALNILRETVMGREAFDHAFKEYCRRWAFKHPTPADFFRTMEDASGIDLDWFWRGWFYGIDNVDIAIDTIQWYKVDMENTPQPIERSFPQPVPKPVEHISKMRNKEAGMEFVVEKDSTLVDFYTNYDPWETGDTVTTVEARFFDEVYTDEEKQQFVDKNYYELKFTNKGGLVMPIILEWTFEDGTKEIDRIPVEIWRKNENTFTKVFVKDKVATGVILDPYKELLDTDESNNMWPVREMPSRFQIFKKHKIEEGPNPMQKMHEGRTIKP